MFFTSPYIGFRVTSWNLLIYLAFLSLLVKKIMIGKPSLDFLLHQVLQTGLLLSLPSFFHVKSRNYFLLPFTFSPTFLNTIFFSFLMVKVGQHFLSLALACSTSSSLGRGHETPLRYKADHPFQNLPMSEFTYSL